jgi:adenylate kinase family enzyme
MRRISIVGNSGSGKTTFGRAVAERLDLPHLELDGIAHQPGWQMIGDTEFRERVRGFVNDNPGWIIEGGYEVVRDIIWESATHVIWLDPSLFANMRAIIGRTLRRSLTREELWNGNREPCSNLYSLDPEESVIGWAWSKHRVKREFHLAAMEDPQWKHLEWVRLPGRRAAERWLDSGVTREEWVQPER